jgi:hypothetical protein
MLYLSGANGYAWYASFAIREHRQVDDVRQTSSRELASFEKFGRGMEAVAT